MIERGEKRRKKKELGKYACLEKEVQRPQRERRDKER